MSQVSLDLYPISWETARQAGRLRYDWARKGQTLSLADATIAAVALGHALTLLTDNRRHFPMAGLSLYPLPAE